MTDYDPFDEDERLLKENEYVNFRGFIIACDEPLNWLEDGRSAVDGEVCSRYSTGPEDSVWLNEDFEEVETE